MSDTIGRVTVQNVRLSTDDDGEVTISAIVHPSSKYMVRKIVAQAKKIELLTLTLANKRNRRSLDQNALMWELLEIMATAMNGGRTGGVEAWDCYIDMLSKYGAKFEYFECTAEAYPALKNMFRAVKIVDERQHGEVKTYMCKAYIGSSQFDTKEMSMLIDGIFDELAKMDVDVSLSRDVAAHYEDWRDMR